jgi:hypothetical protein
VDVVVDTKPSHVSSLRQHHRIIDGFTRLLKFCFWDGEKGGYFAFQLAHGSHTVLGEGAGQTRDEIIPGFRVGFVWHPGKFAPGIFKRIFT